jgi:tRNA uridine 5-carbamoylmethylation protein Kti12
MQLVIMRGPSGAGKSTKARELIEEYLDQNPDATTHICSADDFFVNNKTGQYEFDAKKLGQAHAWCRGQARAAMALKTDLVIIDNTNTQKWEYEPYLELAYLFKYETDECVVGDLDDDSLLLYAERNTHGVPLEAIQRMAQRFE